jgi:hypothetical protein|tara:strand:+ start:288 stop:542 length:255 start_codon:yes stop_codon:yes gene_type:complete
MMSPWRAFNIWRKTRAVLRLVEEIPMSKNIFASKTLWFNVLTAVAELLGVLPLPPGTAVIAAAIVNCGLRIVTATGVHVRAPLS